MNNEQQFGNASRPPKNPSRRIDPRTGLIIDALPPGAGAPPPPPPGSSVKNPPAPPKPTNTVPSKPSYP